MTKKKSKATAKELDEHAVEDMVKLMLDRVVRSVQSVLQLVPDQTQKARLASAAATLLLGISANLLKGAFEEDTGEGISYEASLRRMTEMIFNGAADLGEDDIIKGVAKMRSMTN